MKYVDEFRDPKTAKKLQRQIAHVAMRACEGREKPLQIMEFCGGHTHTIFKYGLEQMLPNTLELVHGPGCPVCVLPRGRVDDCINLAKCDEVILTTFGDAMRVPGSQGSLLQARADGADVRMVYSPMDALQLAKTHPEREVIFFALGFETTMPATALTVLQAAREGIRNFSLFCQHITTAPTLRAILDDPDMHIDGFLAPGHVGMVIGEHPFDFVSKNYKKPLVITGFEPLDILQALLMLVTQLEQGSSLLQNQYKRIVNPTGNSSGLAAMDAVFEPRPENQWRGLGSLAQSGVQMRSAFSHFDAEKKFTFSQNNSPDPANTHCGAVLKGHKRPWQCELYGKSCTPENPAGALMVSSEGACAAYYQYSDKRPAMANPA